MPGFIAFEGIDGCGKSTQLEMLADSLRFLDFPVTIAREPGGTVLGEKLREELLNGSAKLTGRTQTLLFAASRAHLISEVILPKRETDFILCDRWSLSTIAYQSTIDPSVSPGDIGQVCSFASFGAHPDLTFFIDTPVDVCMKRLEGQKLDRFTSLGKHFFEKLREKYLFYCSSHAEGWYRKIATVNVTADDIPEDIHQQILSFTYKHFGIQKQKAK